MSDADSPLDPTAVPCVDADFQRLRREADITQDRLAAIIASSDDAIISKTLGGIIESWNDAAERLFGYTAAEAIGQSILIIIPPDRRDEEREILAKLVRGERIDHYETVRITKFGELRNISLTSSPVRDAAGTIVGASKIARDITARVRSDAHLRLLHEELRQADQAKNDFLATLAHELRNPLAPIRSLLSMLGRSTAPDRDLPAALLVINRQLTQMTRLIDDLMDIARISKNKFELRLEATSLAAIVETASEAVRPSMIDKAQEYVVNLPIEPVRFNGDAARLTQALGNVLGNASKYTPRGGRITLSAARKDGDLVITVADNGIGIPADMLDQIFEMFVQGAYSRRKDEGGLGLGLHLASRLIEMHGGTLTALSEGAGKGSTFRVAIPVVAAALARSAPVPGSSVSRTSRRVLVVDDNRDAADSLGAYLRVLGYASAAVYDGTAALEQGAHFAPDVVLLDIGLPGMDGYETARRIRQESWGQAVRLCALTGWGQEDARRHSKDAGFDAHFVKPVDAAALMAAVERIDVDAAFGLR
jgi:PAS domain S-box-containing protein